VGIGYAESWEELTQANGRHRLRDAANLLATLPTPTTDDAGNITRESGAFQALTRSVQMLPTPNAADGNGGGRGNSEGHQRTLPGTVRDLLPTPTSQAAKHGELSPVERQGNRPQDNGNLWVVMPRLAEEALLPTPAVNDMGEGKTLEWWDDWAPRQKSSDGRPAPHGRSLAIEAQRLLPTPAAQDGNAGGRRWARADFAPTLWEVVSGSRGETTAPPSPDGSTSSDDPHQPQLSLDVQGIPA
jgi:hypothetical protein